MSLNPKWVCGCIPYVPLMVDDEETGICSVCTYIYDERLYTMRLRQHWNDPDNPIPEGTEDLDEILRALSPDYRETISGH